MSVLRIPFADLEPDIPIRVGGVCLVLIDEAVYAVADRCSHEDVSLSQGERVDPDDCLIECWKHGSVFSLITGEAINPPATLPIAVYSAHIEDDEVVVTLP